MNNWFNNIRIYHLLIDRFNGGWQVPPKSENAFCGGNLQGVIEKLDYIKNLGFNAIMLSPIFKSANCGPIPNAQTSPNTTMSLRMPCNCSRKLLRKLCG